MKVAGFRGSRPTVEAMRRHVEQLCLEHILVWHADQKHVHASWSVREFEEIHTAPIRSPLSYATALHEIGHCLGRHQQSRHVMVRETWAWKWARANALFWTPALDRDMAAALAWYASRAAEIDRKWLPVQIDDVPVIAYRAFPR